MGVEESMKYQVAWLVVLCGTAQAADLPKSMQGKWASDPKACDEQASEMAMTVTPRSVLFYEHGYSVRRIARLRDGSVKVSGHSFDEQGRIPDTITLKLVSADKLEASGQVYHRCTS